MVVGGFGRLAGVLCHLVTDPSDVHERDLEFVRARWQDDFSSEKAFEALEEYYCDDRIFSNASGGAYRGGERGHRVAASEAVAQVGVGIDAEFLAGLNQRREDIHRPGAANAAAV